MMLGVRIAEGVTVATLDVSRSLNTKEIVG